MKKVTLYDIKELYQFGSSFFSIRLQLYMNLERLEEIAKEGVKPNLLPLIQEVKEKQLYYVELLNELVKLRFKSNSQKN